MNKQEKHVYILTLKDIVIFAGSNLKVVCQKFKNGVPKDLQKGIKSYAQYSRDMRKCNTLTLSCPYYGTHQITKIKLFSNLKSFNHDTIASRN